MTTACTAHMYPDGSFGSVVCARPAKGEAFVAGKWVPRCGIHLRKYAAIRPVQS